MEVFWEGVEEEVVEGEGRGGRGRGGGVPEAGRDGASMLWTVAFVGASGRRRRLLKRPTTTAIVLFVWNPWTRFVYLPFTINKRGSSAGETTWSSGRGTRRCDYSRRPRYLDLNEIKKRRNIMFVSLCGCLFVRSFVHGYIYGCLCARACMRF